MKKKYSIFITVLLAILCLSACNNDFLDENNQEVPVPILDTVYVDNTQIVADSKISFSIPGGGNMHYKVHQFPKWMSFSHLEGNFADGIANLDFKLNPNFHFDGYGYQSQGLLILNIDGLGRIGLFIVYEDVGSPQFRMDQTDFDFGATSTSVDFRIFNEGDGKLKWKITEAPAWIKPGNLTQGDIRAHEHQYVSLSCNRAGLTPGQYSGTVTIENNSVNNQKKTISVRITVPEPNPVLSIAGTVIGSCFDKSRDILYVITKSPNRLLIYNTKTKPGDVVLSSEVTLQRVPNCISLSENGNQALIGHSELLICYDVSLGRISNSIQLDFNVFGVAYGENNWCYATPDAEYVYEPLISINLTTSEVNKKYSPNVGGRTYFQKVKNKPYLIATRKGTSPSGVILIDISNGIPGEERYWHESYGRLWLSENGEYTYSASKDVLKTPNMSTGQDLLPLMHFSPSSYMLGWADHCEQTSSLWVTAIPDMMWDVREVVCFKGSDFETSKSILPSDYQTTINGKQDYYQTCAHYVFSNKSGTCAYFVKNVKNYTVSGGKTDYNAWSIETVKIQP